MRALVKAITAVAVLALVAGVIAVIYKYTNGFNEGFKTFYVEHNGEQILTADSNIEFEPNVEYRFDVKYTFEKSDAKPLDYNVKILPNATYDFDFTADDKRYKYSKAKELTQAFTVDKQDTYFTVSFTREQTLTKVLSAVYGTDKVIVPSDLDNKCPKPYILVISSYNDSVKYNMRFNIKGVSNNGKEVTGGFEIDEIVLNPDGIIFGGSQ